MTGSMRIAYIVKSHDQNRIIALESCAFKATNKL